MAQNPGWRVIGNGPDVPVHAKNFLHYHNGALRGVSAFRNIPAQLMPIRGRQCNI
jgi:hypothetical protein